MMQRRGCRGLRVGPKGAIAGFAAVGAAIFLTAMVMIGLTLPAAALPAFARQTGQPCGKCHTDFPSLTPFGRRFKLGGYTLGGGDSSVPVAVMLQPSFTRTELGQPGGAAPHFGPNNNFAMQ